MFQGQNCLYTHSPNHSQLIMNISNTANQLVTPQLLKNSKFPKLIHTNPLNSIKIKCKLFTGVTSIISDKLQQCQEFGIQLVRTMEKQLFHMNLYPQTSQNNRGNIFMLEHSLFDLECNLNVVKGVFYMFPIFYEGKLFVRWNIVYINLLSFPHIPTNPFKN